MKKLKFYTVVFMALVLFPVASVAEEITLYAAGSLRSALGDVARAFEQSTGNVIKTEFAPSGLLRQRIEQGEKVHVFASANMAHPKTLVDKGQKGPVALFTRNNLCALAQPEVNVSTSNMLDVLLDPGIRVGTSTPGSIAPWPDYRWISGNSDPSYAGQQASAGSAYRGWHGSVDRTVAGNKRGNVRTFTGFSYA